MPLTILQYITPSRLGGAERYFLKLIEELGHRGHRVIVVTKRDTPLRHELEKLSASLPESERPELHFWHTHGKIDPITLWKLVSLIKRRGVHVINTHLTTASWQGSLAGKITKVPVAAVVHATDSKTFFQFADHLIAVSGGVAEFLVEQGVPRSKIERLYCGLDLRDVAAAEKMTAREAKLRLGIPENAFVVGIAASLIWRKGHRFLLQALKILEKRGLEVHALFAGEGDQEQALREQTSKLKLENRVHFLGFRRDVHQIIAAMDVFTLPSEKEGLSIAVMEAMAMSRPVVATRILGMDEVVIDGENGFLVPIGDADALASALENLLRDADLRAQFAVRGKNFVESRFEQEGCFSFVEEFLEKIAGFGDEKAPVIETSSAPKTHPATRLKRRDLKSVTVSPIQQGHGYQSSVYLVEIDGQKAVVKDFAGTPRWFRRFIAPFLVRRETKTLEYLRDFSAVPCLYTRIDSLAFAMEYIEATPICDLEVGKVQAEVFTNLEKVIDALHRRHVSHCDLKRRRNILVNKRGEVFIIDFAAALIGRQLNPILNWFQREMVEIDNKALPRAKKLVAPQLLTAKDLYQLSNPTRLERWARTLLNR
jgi:glycosyltransferase involved in cell wall biosynthesis/predicted Ser/Thr protein kinase